MAERWQARLERLLEARAARTAAARSCTDRIPTSSRPTSSAAQIGEGTGGVTEPVQAAHRAAARRPARRHRSRDRPRARARVSVRHDHRPRQPAWTKRRATVCRSGSSRGWPSTSSIGPVDSNTAMWLRDAARQEKLPEIKDLERPQVLSVPVGSGVVGLHRRHAGVMRSSASCCVTARSDRRYRCGVRTRPRREVEGVLERVARRDSADLRQRARGREPVRSDRQTDRRAARALAKSSTSDRRSVRTGSGSRSSRREASSRPTCIWPTPRRARSSAS